MEYEDTYCLRRINQKSYQGWQFCCRKKGLEETKFFSDNKCDGKTGAYSSAIKYRDEYFDALKDLNYFNDSVRDYFPIDLTLATNNTSGIIGVCRTVKNRKNRSPEITWQASYKNEQRKNRQKGFSVHQHGELGALRKAVVYRKEYTDEVLRNSDIDNDLNKRMLSYLEELSYISDYLLELDDTEEEALVFLGAINNKDITSTNKKKLLDTRVGQNKFRKVVLNFWNNRCAITGSNLLLTASHIKPWKISNDRERLDVYNGIALSPVYDKAFDVGLISFDISGKIIISERLHGNTASLKIKESDNIDNFCTLHNKYLVWHRRYIFNKK